MRSNPVDLSSVSLESRGRRRYSRSRGLAIVLPGDRPRRCDARRGQGAGHRFGGQSGPRGGVAAWYDASCLAGPLILFTVAVLRRDIHADRRLDADPAESRTRSSAGRVAGWPTKQWHRLSGLLELALHGRRRALRRPPSWIPAAPVTGLPRFELSSSSSDDTVVPAAARQDAFGLFVAGLRRDWRRSLNSSGDGRTERAPIDLVRTDTVREIEPRIETSPVDLRRGLVRAPGPPTRRQTSSGSRRPPSDHAARSPSRSRPP